MSFEDLANADLIVDEIYKAGTQGNIADDPISKLVPVGNQGGFRYKGSPMKNTVRVVVVYMNGAEDEWPDHLNETAGTLTYYGDNRRPGQELLGTRRKGNLLLKRVFSASFGKAADRASVPPFLLFEKAGSGLDVRFRGLLAPGATNLPTEQALTAVWKKSTGGAYENYESRFTVVDVERVKRTWIGAVAAGVPPLAAPDCPTAWRSWVEDLEYQVLIRR